MGKYVYTNRSTPDELQRYLDDVAVIGVSIYANGGYETGTVDGKPVVYYYNKGKANKAVIGTNAFDTVKPKYLATGFYCLNAREFYAGESWVDSLLTMETTLAYTILTIFQNGLKRKLYDEKTTLSTNTITAFHGICST